MDNKKQLHRIFRQFNGMKGMVLAEDILSLDGIGQAQLLRDAMVGSRELIEAAIQRIEVLEPEVQALACCDFERALASVDTAVDGPFRGVPLLLKDNISYPGLRHSLGSRLFEQNVGFESSTYTQCVDAAGFVVLGKSTSSEFSLLPSTETLIRGVTRNPWDLRLSAAGSSGGSAAAVACGMVPLAHANDAAGSIRIPASVCGVFGFSPSADRCVSETARDHLLSSFTSQHCITRSVRDSACFLALTERKDSSAVFPPLGFVRGGDKTTLKIGWYDGSAFGQALDAEVAAALAHSIYLCRNLGHEVNEISGPIFDNESIADALSAISGAQVNDLRVLYEKTSGKYLDHKLLEPYTLALMEWYLKQPAGTLQASIDFLKKIKQEGDQYIRQFDVLLSPVMPIEPFPLGWLSPYLGIEALSLRVRKIGAYTQIYNICGATAMSVPLYWTPSGLPIGTQFSAPAGAEEVLLKLAYQLESECAWRERWPRLTQKISGERITCEA